MSQLSFSFSSGSVHQLLHITFKGDNTLQICSSFLLKKRTASERTMWEKETEQNILDESFTSEMICLFSSNYVSTIINLTGLSLITENDMSLNHIFWEQQNTQTHTRNNKYFRWAGVKIRSVLSQLLSCQMHFLTAFLFNNSHKIVGLETEYEYSEITKILIPHLLIRIR